MARYRGRQPALSTKQKWAIERAKRLQFHRRTNSERIMTERIIRALARAAHVHTGALSRMDDNELEAQWYSMSRIVCRTMQPKLPGLL